MFDLTTTNSTVVYTCPTDRTALIKTIQVTNIHSGANEIEAFTTDASNSGAVHEIAHISLASKTTENLAKGTKASANSPPATIARSLKLTTSFSKVF